ncbi:MAG TPA: hypothetical protein VKS79_02210 [Gemmataceae bacterium]|nr:hypothetical protein [Gemmataceae bacterium]
MNDHARTALGLLLQEHGVATLQSTPKIFLILIQQRLKEYPAEAEVLRAALENQIPQLWLKRAHNKVTAEDLTRQLASKARLQEEVAGWAVDSWTQVLGKPAGADFPTMAGYGQLPPPEHPERVKFVRAGIISGLVAGLLVGLAWGRVSAIGLFINTPHLEYYSQKQQQAVFIEATLRWAGWVVGSMIVGTAVGAYTALRVHGIPIQMVGGVSGVVVGVIGGIVNAQYLIFVVPRHFDPNLAIALKLFVGICIGIIAGSIYGFFQQIFIRLMLRRFFIAGVG